MSPPGRTMADMAAMDALASTKISSRPWYVAAYHGRDAINIQGFTKLRPGRRVTSLAWNGFRCSRSPPTW